MSGAWSKFRGLVILSVVLLLAALLFSLAALSRPAAARSAPGRLLISEFMASNGRSLLDQDGEYSDWIEIHNLDAAPVNLGGWYLTDDDNDLAKWRFPPTLVPGQGYLIVFASGKDRAATSSGHGRIRPG